ncbi:MAG: 1-acyl-sn-glycerol-3-phosphate acyltransferase [Myxococcales bacterium]|nr:1-acyl-sn-glycerol-3-phosphate acyltransferase [Myxococcales bacterium]
MNSKEHLGYFGLVSLNGCRPEFGQMRVHEQAPLSNASWSGRSRRSHSRNIVGVGVAFFASYYGADLTAVSFPSKIWLSRHQHGAQARSMHAFPTMPRQELRGIEKWAVPLMEAVHQRPLLIRVLHSTVGKFNGGLFMVGMHNLLEPHGLDHLHAIDAPKGVILASNHRSFFDMFVISSYVTARTNLMKSLLFPVRSNFFYTHPLGPIINLAASGGTMWPPVFRDERKRTLNAVGFAQMAAALCSGVVVGIHPEGTRGKSSNPYEYLPVKSGLGQLIAHVDPQVRILPCFICGMTSSLRNEFGRNLLPAGKRGEPIRVWFGEGLVAGELQALDLDAQATTQAVFAQVKALGELDRAHQAAATPIKA